MDRVPGERRHAEKCETAEERRAYLAEVRARQDAKAEDYMQNLRKQGALKDEFKEVEEVRNLFASIVSIYKDDIAVETMVERVLFIFDFYQEQPHLLDPHLESLLSQLLDIIRDEASPPEVIHLAFKLMYMMTKTRGYKVILRLMPHEVADVEPVLALLSSQSMDSHGTWETRYMLLLWLSMVCMIPFDMSRLDSNMRSQTGEVRKPVMERIIDVGKLYLEVSDKSRDAAGYMLSRFMTRPDVTKTKLPEFLDWALKKVHTFDKQTVSGQTKIMGILSSLALLFKHGKREDLVPYGSTLLEQIISLKLDESINNNLRKLKIKIVQRIALAFLKSKVASWRYQRGSRSLTDNLNAGDGTTQGKVDESKNLAQEDEEEYDIPDEMEEVIEQLLSGLRDPATIVRWSAAKGIGRVTGRLPQELADEVVGSIMDLFTFTETDAAWHGACLSLAELGRRGLLLPHRLPDVIPVILKSLAYDEKRGNFSVGSHVRDAACYVCWAFARAYEPKDIKPYVTQLATALLIVTVFDREVNVRRAAAAAFQENVGRQGQFPHGIDIVVTCDYFAVGNQSNCFLELSVYLAQFEEYVHALIEHLYKVKVSHWDVDIRDLAAQALNRLTEKAPGFIVETVLPELAENCTTIDLNERHGSVMMSAYTTLALSQIAEKQNKNVSELIGAKTTEVLRTVIQKCHEAKFFLGGGGEIMKKAVCCLIDKLSQAKMPFHKDPVIGAWQDLIDDCLLNVHQDSAVQKAGVVALPAFCTCYYRQSDGSPIPEMQDKIISKYVKELQSAVETTRMGFALALGALPKFMLKGRLADVVNGLVTASQISKKDVKFAEARRDALKALASLCTSVGVDLDGSPNDVLCPANIPFIYDAFFKSMQDYTLDGRGDVGSWVREAGMSGLQTLTSLLVNQHPKLLTPERTEKIFCCLVQQSSEKIDRTREHAGEIFKSLLYHEPELPHIPHREDLMNIFPLENFTNLNLAAPNITFPLFTELLTLPTYSYSVLLGLTVSVGGLTESLVRHSSASLMGYLRHNITDMASCERFCELVQRVCADYPRTDRVMVPMMKMMDQLLASDCFSPLLEKEDPDFAAELLKTCKREVVKCGDPQKILACIDVCCGLLQFKGDVRKRTLQQLLIFLCHRYPIVRKNGAQKLYETVITYDEIIDETKLDEVMTVLSQTEWDEPVESVRPIRNQLCDILDVPRPTLKSAEKDKKPSSESGSTAS